MLFSERQELTTAEEPPQRDSMSRELRTSLWNVVLARLFGKLAVNFDGLVTQDYHVFIALWRHFFKLPMDEFEKHLASRREWFKDQWAVMEWYRVYDFLEFVAQKMIPFDSQEFTRDVNAVLATERSAYRFIRTRLIEVGAPGESGPLSESLESLAEFESESAAQGHFQRALDALGRREDPAPDVAVREALSGLREVLSALSPKPVEDVDTMREVLRDCATENLRDLLEPLCLRAVAGADLPDAGRETALDDARTLLALAATAAAHLLRRGETLGRVPPAVRRTLRASNPDPWNERRQTEK